MKKTFRVTIFMLIALSTNVAFAAQCKFISNDQAQRAEEFIKGNSKIANISVVDYYCESCLDKYPKPIVLDEIKIVRNIIGERAVLMINNKSIDLAYIYVNGANLAHEISCETYAVSAFLN